MSMRKPDDAFRRSPRLIRSFAYAFSGIGNALLCERNLRIHFALGGMALYFAGACGLSRGEWAALILTLSFVVVCELINTSIERLVDLAAHQRMHPLARAAKDIAAGAVLTASAAAVAVGICVFGGPARILDTMGKLAAQPLPAVFLLAAGLALIILPDMLTRED